MQVTTIPKKTVSVIPPPAKKGPDRSKYDQLRVAPYCRVSTDSEEQLTSYTMQKRVYTEMIMSKPEWQLVDIYADEGISGTRADKRNEFQRMIRDCRRGKIDYIITKSVSRFARNTAECIEFVRQLKLMGIGVIFEEQNIDTLKCDSELLMTIHAGFAQAESESISRNITWSYRKRFENGDVVFNFSKILGYRKGADGKPEIIPEEAEIVRSLFDMFLSGMTLREIADYLKAEGIRTKSGKDTWSIASVQNILKNEKYCGDAITQKTVTVDCISKTRKKNTGEAPMYYIRNNHPAIIDRKTFHKAQAEMARRNSKRSPSDKSSVSGQGRHSRYALSDVMHCGECGTKYRRTIWCVKGERIPVWRCCNRLDHGKQFCKHSPTIKESDLHEAIVRAMSKFSGEDYDSFHSAMLGSIADAIGINENSAEADLLVRQISMLNKEMMALVDMTLKSELSMEENEQKFKEISDEIAQLTERLEAVRQSGKTDEERLAQAAELEKALNGLRNCGCEYNDNAVRQMIECIKVYSDGKLDIIFNGGYTVVEYIDLEQNPIYQKCTT